MKVREIMTRNVQLASPDQTIQEIAKRMAEEDIGFLPVGENDRMIGMITDRDIVVRCLAAGKDGRAKVREAMTQDVKYCFDDDDLDEVMENMGELQVRRLPVISREKRLIGILSLADAARQLKSSGQVAECLSAVVTPGGAHSQSTHEVRGRARWRPQTTQAVPRRACGVRGRSRVA